jgi:WhiB family redox-sensing transcriptional regulator
MHGRHVGDPNPQQAHAGKGLCYRCYGRLRAEGMVSVAPRNAGIPCAKCHVRTRAGGGICSRCQAAARKPAETPKIKRDQRPRPGEWQAQGECQYADDTLFYHPENESGKAKRDRDELAEAVCAECPVRTLCRDYARAAREPYGVWGMETEDERASWLRAQRPSRQRKTVAA